MSKNWSGQSRVSSHWKNMHWKKNVGHWQTYHRLCSPVQSHQGNKRMPRIQNQSISLAHLNLRVMMEITTVTKGDETTHLIHKLHSQWENCRKLPGPRWFDLVSITIPVHPFALPYMVLVIMGNTGGVNVLNLMKFTKFTFCFVVLFQYKNNLTVWCQEK